MPEVDFLVLDRFFAAGPSLTADVLASANIIAAHTVDGPAPFSWRVLTEDGGPVRSSAGLSLAADGAWGDARAELQMVFGVGMADRDVILHALRDPACHRLVDHLRVAHGAGATLLASCSSTFLLAETGRLDGGPATTSWWLAPLFRQRYPRIALEAECLVTEHERVMCAGAAMAQLDLALHVVRRFAGMELARAVARYLVIDDARVSQAPYLIVDHLAGHDPVVAKAEAWVRTRLAETVDVREMARAAAVSERTLRRRFVAATGLSPALYVQRARAEAAADLLRTTDWSIGRIAEAVGYAEDGALRRAFQRHFDASPRAWRQKARQPAGLSTSGG